MTNKEKENSVKDAKMKTQMSKIISKAERESKHSSNEIDTCPANYTLSDICPRGSLIKLRKTCHQVMHVENEAFETITEGSAVLVFHSLVNKIDSTHVITFMQGESLYMFVSPSLLEDFEILSLGTITQDHDPLREKIDE